ncbi:MAG: hypothetical protein J6B10_08035 [Lachnospiraceae bacterium]|nr:hypothetical protein [Lachnospiraceae bacterium]
MRCYTEGKDRELTEVRCNRCGRNLTVEKGILKEGCVHVDYDFGYFSSRDGICHRFDLCEECYEEIIQAFVLPVTEEESTELL